MALGTVFLGYLLAANIAVANQSRRMTFAKASMDATGKFYATK